MHKRTAVVIAATAMAMVGGLPAAASAAPTKVGGQGGAPNAVVAWNEYAGEAALACGISPGNDPLHESRIYAMTHVAIHDVLNAIDRHAEPYAYDPDWLTHDASPAAAVASAARNVLVPLFRQLPPEFQPGCANTGVASVLAAYDTSLAAIPDGRAKRRGIEVGQAAARAILQLRADDGSNQPLTDPNYPQGTEPGQYRFTPGTPFAFLPHWGDVTPFVLRSSSQYLPGPPYPVTSQRYTADFKEVKRLGGDGVTTPSARTPDQTQIALFWVESSPLLWNRLARSVATDRHVGLWDSARLFALLNMAMNDGYIGSFHAKFDVYNYWRPVTAIQLAANDGNPDTVADPNWTPLVTTPPIPDYDSGHAVEGGAAAEVLKRFFATDHVRSSNCSMTLPAGQTCTDPHPVTRSWSSFTQAANENGVSRILVGFHFRKAVTAGIEHGRAIGDRAVNRFLQPVH